MRFLISAALTVIIGIAAVAEDQTGWIGFLALPNIAVEASGNALAVSSRPAATQSTRWIQQLPAAPDPPRDLIVASVIGNTVALAWKAPASGTPTGYVLEGGLSPGSVLAGIPTASTATSFTFTAPSGVFFARLHALSGRVRSAASNEIHLVVNAPVPPSTPAPLLGLVSGSTVALSWTNTFLGGAPTALHLNVTGSQTTTIPLGVSDTVSFNGVPGGTYTLTLTASNAAGVSPPSDPVTLSVPGSCSGPPGVPTYFAVAKSGSTLTLTWNPPVSGTAVTSYVIHASGAFTGSLPTLTKSLSATVGPGTYTLSVVAANACGTSAPSDVITVTVGPEPPPATHVVTGIVLGDGQPLAHVGVSVRGEPQNSSGPHWRVDTSTDASGRYRAGINVTMPTRVWVTAYDDDMFQPCAVWFRVDASDGGERTADVALTSSRGLSAPSPVPTADRRTITGKVYTLTGAGKEPAADVDVVFDLTNDDIQAWTRTDAEGRFMLCALPVDSHLLIHAFQGSLQAWAVMEPGGDADIELILSDSTLRQR